MQLLDKIPLLPLAVMAIFLGLAPFKPMPHLVEKIGMLMDGTLSKPIDIFDLFQHSILIIILVLKLVRMMQVRSKA